MTLVLKLDLNMVKIYHHTKNEVSMSTYSKVVARTDRQTHTHTDIHTDRQTHTHTDMTKTLPQPHMQEVITYLRNRKQFHLGKQEQHMSGVTCASSTHVH